MIADINELEPDKKYYCAFLLWYDGRYASDNLSNFFDQNINIKREIVFVGSKKTPNNLPKYGIVYFNSIDEFGDLVADLNCDLYNVEMILYDGLKPRRRLNTPGGYNTIYIKVKKEWFCEDAT
jgi:hypothetical protein